MKLHRFQSHGDRKFSGRMSTRRYTRLQHVMRYGAMPERHITIKRELTVAALELAKRIGRFIIEPVRSLRRR